MIEDIEDSATKPNASNKLIAFLSGTLQSQSPVKLLRGQGDLLKQIWIFACSEWWSMHFHMYKYPVIRGHRFEIKNPLDKDSNRIVDLRECRHIEKTSFMDCPAAIIATEVPFPPLASDVEPLFVNMMPFDLFDPKNTLPPFLHNYIGLIERCSVYQKPFDSFDNRPPRAHRGEEPEVIQKPSCIAYLTIDERPAEVGTPQRRGGVHVESPGALRSKEIADKSQYCLSLSRYHPWGFGRMNGEYLDGGIYLASNMANTTAVWNCRVYDTYGDVIAPHGSLERCRDVLGPATKCLEAGELLWISDRTPHESLPIPTASFRRQFFRLVVGEIAFWFAAHNTPNPTGYRVPSEVQTTTENKFVMTKHLPIVWECGAKEEIAVAKQAAEFRAWLHYHNLGFMMEFLATNDIHSKKDLRDNINLCMGFGKELTGQYGEATTSYILHTLESLGRKKRKPSSN